MAPAVHQPLRYAVLRHEGVSPAHFDLMFETGPGSALATWRSETWPIDRPTKLTQLPDHRRDYLSYEGPLTKGRGWVQRVAGGSCTIDRPTDTWFVRFLPPPALPPLCMLDVGNGEWDAWPGA